MIEYIIHTRSGEIKAIVGEGMYSFFEIGMLYYFLHVLSVLSALSALSER
jgi:hypothetical protein